MYTSQHIKVVLAKSPKIIEVSEDILKDEIISCLDFIYNDLGHVPVKEDRNYLTIEIHKLIRGKYHFLGIKEIKLAFRNGIQKVYGEYYGVNFVSLSMFLKAYSESQERCDARVQLQTETRSSRLLEAPQQEFDGEAWVEKLFAEFKENGTCEDHGNLAYDYLNKNGLIKLSYEQKEIIWNEAQAFCKAKLKAEKEANRNLFHIRELEKKLIEVLEAKQSPMVVVKAKQLALIEHFKGLTRN